MTKEEIRQAVREILHEPEIREELLDAIGFVPPATFAHSNLEPAGSGSTILTELYEASWPPGQSPLDAYEGCRSDHASCSASEPRTCEGGPSAPDAEPGAGGSEAR